MRNSITRRFNQKYSKTCVNAILEKEDHLLRFLINPETKWWWATRHGKENPSVQIGHALSLHAGGPELLFLEDADANQLSNWKGETQGVIFKKKCVKIDGIHVDYRTAKMWERLGLLPEGTVYNSPVSEGWSPC